MRKKSDSMRSKKKKLATRARAIKKSPEKVREELGLRNKREFAREKKDGLHKVNSASGRNAEENLEGFSRGKKKPMHCCMSRKKKSQDARPRLNIWAFRGREKAGHPGGGAVRP